MWELYFIIGGVVGGIFALGVIILGMTGKQELINITNRNNSGKVSNATMLLFAVVANVVLWPVIVAFLASRLKTTMVK